MDIRFADHPSFQRAAAGMVGCALLFGAALHPVTHHWAPLVGGGLGIAAGAVIGRGPSWPRGWRGLAGLVFGAAAILAAIWCAKRIEMAQQTAAWSAFVRNAVASAAVGLVGLLALLPRHLQLVSDPVRAALAKLPSTLDAEVRGLCERAARIWANAETRVDEGSRTLIRDGVVTTLQVAAKSSEIRAAGPSDLDARIADLDQRIAAATDREVIAQYQSARGALADQQRYHDNIQQRRERLVARMHNHIAALEKFELAATDLSAAHALAETGSALAALE